MRTHSTDFLIIGAGSAGCVLAARLSEAGHQVALVEAGPDTPPWHVPDDIRDLYPRSYSNREYMWPKLEAELGAIGVPGELTPFPQARVMGGGSSVMGMIALRGLPADYEGWRDAGATGWGWSDVLPAFRRLETDWDFDGPLHGSDGPVAIRRHRPEDWPPFCQAVAEAAERRGYPLIDDMNADFRSGYGRLPQSSTLSGRVSAASAYLNPEVRSRPNLRIECNSTVTALRFSGTRCIGADLIDGKHILASETIVCAGAIHTPAILQRAGIGPARELEALGIPVVSGLEGVGANLQNHPVLYLAAHLKPGARQSPLLRPHFNSCLRFDGHDDPAMQGDMLMLVMNKSSWHGLGHSIAGLGISVYSPYSRGSVSLKSVNPTESPRVNFGMLEDPRDASRMLGGLIMALDFMQDRSVRPLRHEIFTAGYSKVVRRLNQPGIATTAITKALAGLLDGPEVLRKLLIRVGIAQHDAEENEMRNRSWLKSTVQRRTFGMYHPAGTCRIGDPHDRSAVLDPACSVLGTDGLRVVDASAMPRLVRANTNLPVMMMAERAAELLLA